MCANRVSLYTHRYSYFCRCPVNFKQALIYFTHIALFSR
uniref:Secreted protein n=1 Tax=Mesocestoides corti TaxID=53468 RepID=A0A5K3FY44_MESCO